MSSQTMQNTIAMIWDFDKTLIPNYMQLPLFRKYNIDEKQFWSEVEQLTIRYGEQGIKANPDTSYLNHLITYANEGYCAGLNNQVLRSLGRELPFFDGMPAFLEKVKHLIADNPTYDTFDLKVEHYIVSTGLTEMIKGSQIADYVDGIWGCEFIENPLIPSNDGLILKNNTNRQITSIAYAIDNTSKTRAIFEINKGVNKYPDINVNQKMREEDRRVPFDNMIYIADGPSDIPAFSVVKNGGGKAFAVYQKDSIKSFQQVKKLLDSQRVDMFGEADYREGSLTYLWLTEQVKEIAERVVERKRQVFLKGKNGVPTHINENQNKSTP